MRVYMTPIKNLRGRSSVCPAVRPIALHGGDPPPISLHVHMYSTLEDGIGSARSATDPVRCLVHGGWNTCRYVVIGSRLPTGFRFLRLACVRCQKAFA